MDFDPPKGLDLLNRHSTTNTTMDIRIHVRMSGQGFGPGYEANMKHMTALPSKLERVHRLRLYAVSETDQYVNNVVNMDAIVPTLDLLDYLVHLELNDWLAPMHNLGYRFETCPNVHINHPLSNGLLDFSSATVDQILRITDAPRIRGVIVGEHTYGLYLVDAPRLWNISCRSELLPKLCTLSMLRCRFRPAMTTFKRFHHIKNLSIDGCRFLGLGPIKALRSSLVHLSLWRSCHEDEDEDDMDPEPITLHLNRFRHLETISIGQCHFLQRLSFSQCPQITDVEVINCTLLETVRCQDRDGPSIVCDLSHLASIKIISCSRLTTMTIENLGELLEVSLDNSLVDGLHIDGNTCPAITQLNLAHNQLCDDSCHLNGMFRNLLLLALTNNRLTRMSPSWVGNMPSLRLLSLGNNHFVDPVDLSSYTSLTELDFTDNSCPTFDRGNMPFKLRVMLDPNMLTPNMPCPNMRTPNMPYPSMHTPLRTRGDQVLLIPVGETISHWRLGPEDIESSDSSDDEPMVMW